MGWRFKAPITRVMFKGTVQPFGRWFLVDTQYFFFFAGVATRSSMVVFMVVFVVVSLTLGAGLIEAR